MPAPQQTFRIWDAYWQDDRINSLGANADPQILTALERHWTGVVRRLAPGAKVLDVGCGNGAAGLALLNAAELMGTGLSITGIDEAAIDPPRYVPQYAEVLSKIDFRPSTMMETLPFPQGSFDAVVSQFGFEYGNVAKAISEAARVLKPNGLLTFLAVSVHSAAAKAAAKGLKQARYILRESNLFKDAFNIIQTFHGGAVETRDDKLRVDLEQFNTEVEKAVRAFNADDIDIVFAIIMSLNNAFVDRKTVSADQQMMSLEGARTALARYAARANATTKAAISDSNLEALKRTIGASGFKLTDAKSLIIPGYPMIGWQITANRLTYRA